MGNTVTARINIKALGFCFPVDHHSILFIQGETRKLISLVV